MQQDHFKQFIDKSLAAQDDLKKTGSIEEAFNSKKPEDESLTNMVNKLVNGYHQDQKDAGPDDLKIAVAGMVNEAMIDDTVKMSEEALPGRKVPDRKMLKEMQEFAFRWKKKHIFAKPEQVQAAVALHFNLIIIDNPDA